MLHQRHHSGACVFDYLVKSLAFFRYFMTLPFETPRLTNVDQLAIETSILVKHFEVCDQTIHARPLNTDDYWILKAVFPNWETLDVFDLLHKYQFEAGVMCVWLGTRRDTLAMRSKAAVDDLILPVDEVKWQDVLVHIISIDFVSSENGCGLCPTPKPPNDTLTQLKNMKTVKV